MSRPWAIVLLVGFAALIGAVVFLGIQAVERVHMAGGVDPADVDSFVGNFRFDTLDGGRLGPEDFRGDVVVIDIWATWCQPCRVQNSILEGLREELADQGVSFLAVNTGEDVETAQAYIDDSPFSYPVLLDPEDELMGRLGFFALPTLVILDPEGNVSYVAAGITGASVLRQAIERARLGSST